ncbi:MAG: hypothetical protein IJ253_11845 [Bacteroidaceae bacterium]|nr:hypothetical protein [Bacteroidaceae bacterium]
MKEKYEAPNLQVVHVNVKHIVAVSQIGEGTGGFDVKHFNGELEGDAALKQRNLWEEEW